MKLRQEYLEFAAKSGWTATYTAAVYGVTAQGVRWACARHNIKLIDGRRGPKVSRGPVLRDPLQEALIMQSITEAWTLQELGDKLGVTRERARQLLKKRGLDKIRVNHQFKEPKEKPIRPCRECGQIILDIRRRRFCSEGCSEAWSRRYHAANNRARYRADPALREYQAKYRRDNPDKAAASTKRYRGTVGGQLYLEKVKMAYQAEPKKTMQCLDCGTLVERKPTTVRQSRGRGYRSPLCKDCRQDAAVVARGLSRADDTLLAKKERST